MSAVDCGKFMLLAYWIIAWITIFGLIWELVSQQAVSKAIIISPENICYVTTLKGNRVSLQRLYNKSHADGNKLALSYFQKGR